MHPCARILLVVGLVLSSGAAARADRATKTLDVYWVDSEGGGSTLLVTPAGESLLIDAGNPGARDSKRIVAAAKAAGLTRIDYLLLTHYHIDHFGGAAEVAQELPFGKIYQRAIPAHDPDGRPQSSFPLQIKAYREMTAPRVALVPGVSIPLRSPEGGPRLELRCLASEQKFVAPTPAQMKTPNRLAVPAAPKATDTSDNANSAVFLLSFGAFRFFDGGDLTWNLEEKLVSPYNLAGVVDVYQTNHHGLEISNNPLLVQSLAPAVVVMNNGPRKGGQPGTFAVLKSTPSIQALYQVHKSFNVPADVNAPDACIANFEDLRGPEAAKCGANLVKMSVAPDAKSYTISIPATGYTRTYRTKATRG